MRPVGPVANRGLAPASYSRRRVFHCLRKHPLMPDVAAMCLINRLAASPLGRLAIFFQRVGYSREAFVDLGRRQVHVTEEHATFETRKRSRVQNGAGMQRVDTNSHASRQLLELDSGRTVSWQLPKHMGSACVAGY